MKGERLVVLRQTELLEHLADEKDMTVKFKLAFLKCFSSLDDNLEVACQDFGMATSTGYRWLRTWNHTGYAGLSDTGHRTGRLPRLDDSDLLFLTYLLHRQATWTTAEVQELIQRYFDIEYSPNQVIRILRNRVGMYFNKPFPHDDRRPTDAEARLKASLHQVFNTLKEKGIPKEDIAIGLLDEASPQNRANTVRLWSFEHSPVVRKNTTHFQTNTIGFYAIQGVSVQHFMADSKTESVVDFLHRVKAANATFKAIIIVLDNYSTHHSGQVKATARELDMYLVYLPSYSPDLNPLEYIWKSIKRIMSRSCIQTLDEMKETIAEGWKKLSGSLGFAKKWIAQFLKTESYYNDLCK